MERTICQDCLEESLCDRCKYPGCYESICRKCQPSHNEMHNMMYARRSIRMVRLFSWIVLLAIAIVIVAAICS